MTLYYAIAQGYLTHVLHNMVIVEWKGGAGMWETSQYVQSMLGPHVGTPEVIGHRVKLGLEVTF